MAREDGSSPHTGRVKASLMGQGEQGRVTAAAAPTDCPVIFWQKQDNTLSPRLIHKMQTTGLRTKESHISSTSVLRDLAGRDVVLKYFSFNLMQADVRKTDVTNCL